MLEAGKKRGILSDPEKARPVLPESMFGKHGEEYHKLHFVSITF